jgi:LemA protein
MEFLFILLLVGLLLGVIFIYNSLVKAKVMVEESWAQIEVQLNRRADLIPNLVETVKGYAKHEKATFDSVTKARGVAQASSSPQEKAVAENFLTQALRGLLAVAEAYPDLKASSNFLSLQEELATTENKIAFARQRYNDMVARLNKLILTIPYNFFVTVAKVEKAEFFDAPEKADNPPEVKF